MKTEQQLPKNIRQIGSPAGHTKVYIEDYVITFLNSLSMDKNTYVRGAILFGEKKQIGNDLVIFIRGAIEGQNLELDLNRSSRSPHRRRQHPSTRQSRRPRSRP